MTPSRMMLIMKFSRFRDQPKQFLAARIQKLVARWGASVAVPGDYRASRMFEYISHSCLDMKSVWLSGHSSLLVIYKDLCFCQLQIFL